MLIADNFDLVFNLIGSLMTYRVTMASCTAITSFDSLLLHRNFRTGDVLEWKEALIGLGGHMKMPAIRRHNGKESAY